ncbi:MAG: V-type ATP synthase subunit E [Planctomycetota bacterium]
MTVERIREAIIGEAEEEARRIESEAEERCEKRLQKAEQALKEEFEERFEAARAQRERECERRVIQKRSEYNLQLLNKRNRILDDLFHRAAQSMADMSDEAYRDLMERWMEEVPEDAAGSVVCNEDDEDRIRPLVDKMNETRGDDAQLELEPGDRPDRGGVIFRAESFEIDMSIDTRLADLRDRLAPEVARRIFPEDVTV